MTNEEQAAIEKEFARVFPSWTEKGSNEYRSFMCGAEFVLGMLNKTKARESFQEERFKRAFILARQMTTLLTQTLVVLNTARAKVLGPDGKPHDPLGIGKTAETVALAIKSAQNVLEVLKVVQPDEQGNPVIPGPGANRNGG